MENMQILSVMGNYKSKENIMKKNLWLVVLIFLFLMVSCTGKKENTGSNNEKKVEIKPVSVFGEYPANYELAYINMMGYIKSPKLNDLFGENSPGKKPIKEGKMFLGTVESIDGSSKELVVTILISQKSTNTQEEKKVMRVQFKFQADPMAEKSYARYCKIINLVSGEISEIKSYGGAREDGQVLGALVEIFEMIGWDLSEWK